MLVQNHIFTCNAIFTISLCPNNSLLISSFSYYAMYDQKGIIPSPQAIALHIYVPAITMPIGIQQSCQCI